MLSSKAMGGVRPGKDGQLQSVAVVLRPADRIARGSHDCQIAAQGVLTIEEAAPCRSIGEGDTQSMVGRGGSWVLGHQG